MSCLCPATHFHNILARIVLGCCLIFASLEVQSTVAHSATLRWASNTEPDLIGYKVYQGTTPGSYGLAVDVGNTTMYSTQNLQDGRRYYFAITAYDKSGNESSPSTEVSLQTPTPSSVPIQPNIPSMASTTANANAGTFLADWNIVGVGNLDGDGRADIVVRNRKTGDVGGWLGNGLTLGATGLIAVGVPAEWTIAGLGDLDGDGKDDIVVRHASTGDVGVWLGNGVNEPTHMGVIGGLSSHWTIVGIGDMDDDGRSDILWRDATNGSVAVWQGNGMNVPSTVRVLAASVPAPWEIVGVGDLDGNGESDIVWRNKADGSVAIWQGNGGNAPTTASVLAGSVPLEWEIPS